MSEEDKEDKLVTVIRIVHNRENPYVQLNKNALWDPNLSLKAVGLWARCMSRPTDWKFSIKELSKSGKEGRRAIYSAVQELIECGYAIRVEYYERDTNGQFQKGMGGMEYVFFEFPATEQDKNDQIEKFKKSFRQCGFGDRRNGDSRNVHLQKKEDIHINKDIDISPPAPISIYSDKKEVKKSLKKIPYGEHVMLYEAEYNQLKSEWGQKALDDLIQDMNQGIGMKGYKYKDFNLALRHWYKLKLEKNPSQKVNEQAIRQNGADDISNKLKVCGRVKNAVKECNITGLYFQVIGTNKARIIYMEKDIHKDIDLTTLSLKGLQDRFLKEFDAICPVVSETLRGNKSNDPNPLKKILNKVMDSHLAIAQ